jgi:hypothetical protein
VRPTLNEAPHPAIDALFLEERRYPPPPGLAKEANAQPGIYERDFVEFWASEARERVSWSTPFDQVWEWDPPYARWFLGGRLNACYNCVDRHVEAGRGEKVAFYWGGRPGRGSNRPSSVTPTPPASWTGGCRWTPAWSAPTSTPPAPARSLPMRL